MLDVARRPASRASWASASCSGSASRRTGPARRRPSPSGSRGATADGRSRCSTAARRSAARSRRSSCCGCITTFGSWRPAFIVTGVLGFLWLILFRMAVPIGPKSIRASRAEERATDPGEGRASAATGAESRPRAIARCSRCRRRGASSSARSLTDPVWFFITDWFAIYLVAEGLRARGEPARVLGAVSRGGPRQLRRRRRVELADQARLGRRRRAEAGRASCRASA